MKRLALVAATALTFHALAASSTPKGFTDNLDEALKSAASTDRKVFAVFSGSDWCHWCVKLDKEVLEKDEFVKGATNNFVLVFIDSPRNQAVLSEHAKAHNRDLTKKYGIRGFPTALVLDKDGKRIATTGYVKGGPAQYLKLLTELLKMIAEKPAELSPPPQPNTHRIERRGSQVAKGREGK